MDTTDTNERLYLAMIWVKGSGQAENRVTVYALSLADARQHLEIRPKKQISISCTGHLFR